MPKAVESGIQVLHSAFVSKTWILDSNWWDYGFLELYSGFRNPDSWPYMTGRNVKDEPRLSELETTVKSILPKLKIS